MCKHIDILVASRKAVESTKEAVLDMLVEEFWPYHNTRTEFWRRLAAYDALLLDIGENGCRSCKFDFRDPYRKSDYLKFVEDYVTHHDGGKCDSCKSV
jgi:uncharacterized membrane protein